MRMNVSVGMSTLDPRGDHSTGWMGPHAPGYGVTSVGKLQPNAPATNATASAASSALAVKPDLFAHDVVVDSGAQVVLQAVRERDHHVVHAPVFDQLAQQLASFGAVVFTQKIPHHVQGE